MIHPDPCPVCSDPATMLLEVQRAIWRQIQVLDHVALRRGQDAISWAARESLRQLVPMSVRNETLEQGVRHG